MFALHKKLQQWSAEFTEIGGAPIPDGFLRFLSIRLTESGLVPDQKDVITIYRDGHSEKVRVLSQDGHVVAFETSNGSVCHCTVDQMKRWAKGADIVRASDYTKHGESGLRTELIDRLGGESGTGTISIDSVDPD